MVTTSYISSCLLRQLRPQHHVYSSITRLYLRQPSSQALSGAGLTVKPARPHAIDTNCRVPALSTVRSAFGPRHLALIVCGCLFGSTLVLYSQLPKLSSSKSIEDLGLPLVGVKSRIMVGTLQSGRPGNLTPEQEVKLQQLWKVTLKVFGVPVLDKERSSGLLNESLKDESEDDDVAEQSGTANPEQRKKKRGLFRRKKNDGANKSMASSVHSSVADSDDKYGQTKDFQQALATQSPEDLRKAFWSMVKHDHPDGLLLRFLRARKWDVEKALIMLISTMHWRSKEMHVDDEIIWKGEAGACQDENSASGVEKKEGHDFMAQMRLGKSFLHGCDIEGRPMCFVQARLHKQGEQSEASLERVTVHIIETARLFLSPPVDTATIIFDMTGFSMANMDYAPVKFMIKCFEANYPESLGVVLVHKSPWVFQGIWKIIKGWLDPVVAGKVHFTNNIEELTQFIPLAHVPSDLGGKDPWTFHYAGPQPGENDKMADVATRNRLEAERALLVKEFERTTQEWMHGAPQRNGELLERREEVAERLRSGYWVLDPYIRARTSYDRTGTIRKDGSIEYYPNHDVDGVD